MGHITAKRIRPLRAIRKKCLDWSSWDSGEFTDSRGWGLEVALLSFLFLRYGGIADTINDCTKGIGLGFAYRSLSARLDYACVPQSDDWLGHPRPNVETAGVQFGFRF